MIRKTKKGPRRLREMPVYKLAEHVISAVRPRGGRLEPHTAYRTRPGESSLSRRIDLDGGGEAYILLEGCAHLAGRNWNVELRKEYR